MLSILESTGQLGGMIGRTITTVAVPIPGAGVVLAPVGSAVGETIGKVISSDKKKSNVPTFLKDSLKIYKSGGEKNTSLSLSDQIKIRRDYANKAKELGYNKIGQAISAVDPSLISITPKKLLKN